MVLEEGAIASLPMPAWWKGEELMMDVSVLTGGIPARCP